MAENGHLSAQRAVLETKKAAAAGRAAVVPSKEGWIHRGRRRSPGTQRQLLLLQRAVRYHLGWRGGELGGPESSGARKRREKFLYDEATARPPRHMMIYGMRRRCKWCAREK